MSVLLESAGKGSVILLVVMLAGLLLTRQSAALRHWVLTMAMVCAWLMPPLSWALPSRLSTPLWPSSNAHLPASARPASPGAPALAAAEAAAARTVRSVTSDPSVSPARMRQTEVAWRLWIIGSLMSALVLLTGLARLWWLGTHASPVTAGPWYDLGQHMSRTNGLPAPVSLLQSTHPSLLVTWGWRRPKILLPAAARDWPRERVQAVLAHELAHVTRRDWAVQLAAEWLRVVYWFNPLTWILCRRLRHESECACDDAVLASGIDGPTYATHLLALARSLRATRQPWLPAPAMARRFSLEGRVRAMLNLTLRRDPVSWKARLAAAGALLILAVPVAGLRAQSQFYSLSGTVLDPTNRVLPDTRLILTNLTSRAKHEVRTDATGRFEFVGLPPAEYRLDTSLPGFAPLEENITIGGNAERELRLPIASLQEMITVTGRPIPPPDAAALQQREEARRRFAEFEVLAKTRCAGGAANGAVGGNILAPRKTVDVRPMYPEALRAAGIGGTVTMDAVVGTDGIVREVKHLKGPHPDLEAAAAEAVRQWQFSGTLLNCEPIDVEMSVTVAFRVEP